MSIPPIVNDNHEKPLTIQPKTMANKERLLSEQPHAYPKSDWNVRDAVLALRDVLPSTTLTYEAIRDVSLAYLPYEQRSIINYLRRHPEVFSQVRDLSDQAIQSIPEYYTKITLDDLQARQVTDRRDAARVSNDRLLQTFNTQIADRQMADLFRTLRRLLPEYAPQLLPQPAQQPQTPVPQPQYLPVAALVNLAQNPGIVQGLPLEAAQRAQLTTLLNPTILNLIQAQARTQQMMMNPDFIRIITSLLFNPMMHRPGGTSPLAAFERSQEEEDQGTGARLIGEEEPLTVEGTNVTESHEMEQMHEPHDPTEVIFQRIELSAEQIKQLCRHLKQNGGITLEEFQRYQPVNQEEEELLRYLRQFSIFHAIADLNGKDETLDPSDIRRALDNKTLILDDEHITLVIKP